MTHPDKVEARSLMGDYADRLDLDALELLDKAAAAAGSGDLDEADQLTAAARLRSETAFALEERQAQLERAGKQQPVEVEKFDQLENVREWVHRLNNENPLGMVAVRTVYENIEAIAGDA